MAVVSRSSISRWASTDDTPVLASVVASRLRGASIGAMVLLLAGVNWCRAEQPIADTRLCRAAGAAAEAQLGIPAGLLAAIGRVESGRPDPVTGMVAAWPWTINGNGAGRMFGSAAAAISGTRALQQVGVSSIDVGCFQINLLHHPTAFSSLEQAFDPKANAAYAARFLSSLHQRLGSWEAAVAAYHSSTPEKGFRYRERVLAGWGAPREWLPVAQPAPIDIFTRTSTMPGAGPKVWTPSAFGSAAHVITIPPAHGAGR